MSTLNPTMKFRWLQVHMADTANHRHAIRIGGTNYAQVLQQWWEGVDKSGEWRDISMESER